MLAIERKLAFVRLDAPTAKDPSLDPRFEAPTIGLWRPLYGCRTLLRDGISAYPPPTALFNGCLVLVYNWLDHAESLTSGAARVRR